MKAKAEIGTRFIKLEALSRVPLSACAFRVLLWFIAYTYGRRVKRDGEWCAIDAVDATHNYIAEDTGLHRSRISSVINRLLQFKIIRSKTDGSLGLNSNLQQWAIRFAGRDFKAIPSPTVLGQTVLGPKRTNNVRFCPPISAQSGPTMSASVPPRSYARGESLEYVEMERAAIAAKRTPSTLSNGKLDTPQNRADLGSVKYLPEDHPEFRRLSFALQNSLPFEWQQECDRIKSLRINAEHEKFCAEQGIP